MTSRRCRALAFDPWIAAGVADASLAVPSVWLVSTNLAGRSPRRAACKVGIVCALPRSVLWLRRCLGTMGLHGPVHIAVHPVAADGLEDLRREHGHHPAA